MSNLVKIVREFLATVDDMGDPCCPGCGAKAGTLHFMAAANREECAEQKRLKLLEPENQHIFVKQSLRVEWVRKIRELRKALETEEAT